MVPAGDAIDMLSQILLSAHHMNLGDKPEEIKQDKIKYVRNQITRLYKAGKVNKGTIKYYDSLHQYSDASGYYSDGSCDFFEDDARFRMDMKLSTVNIKQLAKEIVLELEDTGNSVPADLMILLGDNNHQPVVVSKSVIAPIIQVVSSNDTNVAAPAVEKEDAVTIAPEAVVIPSVVDEDIKAGTAPTDHKYCFIKHGLGWNIQFGDIELIGVNHSVGMDYIKILLQKRYDEISVFDLQAMLNPDYIQSSLESSFNDHMADEEDDSESTEDTDAQKRIWNRLSDEERAIANELYQQLKEYKADLAAAKLYKDIVEEKRLTELKNMLEDDLYAMLNSRTDDPVLDKNRKKIYKNIEDARKNIKIAEIAKGYEDTPTYNYLKKYINTGSSCKYNPLVDDSIQWIL